MKAANQFDRVARVYDRLAKLVFGTSIVASQQFFLREIPANARILILGGGTGWILNEIAAATTACEIWYIDASEKMIEQAKNANANLLPVHFIHGTEDDIPPTVSFDILITNFYLDLFDERELYSVLDKITQSLTGEVRWIVTDFLDRKRWWQSLMLNAMYSFFRIVTGLENRRLPDWNLAIQRNGFAKIGSRLFYRGFIEAAIFAKK